MTANRRLFATSLLILLCILGIRNATAADLVVRDFKALPTDQTAINRETMKKDQNGKTAALIKINTRLAPEEIYFDNGVTGIVGTIHKPGQIWLYIPSRSQSLTISNSRYGLIQYHFPQEIQAGRTYFMELTVEGKDVTLAPSVIGATLYVDEEEAGHSPLNLYLPYGDHYVKAQKGSMLYEGSISVTKNGPDRFVLPMEDENLNYSDVSVTVPGKAEIWFEGRQVGLGEWHTRLKAGEYTVELRQQDCETAVEHFKVVRGEPTVVKGRAPAPFSGYLSVEVAPAAGVRIYEANTDTLVAEHHLSARLPIGDYCYTIRKKGYVPQTCVFSVARDVETRDTVTLRRIQYIRSNSVYAGVGIGYGGGLGVGANVGLTVSGVNLEVGYTAGLTKSDELYWFENATDLFDSKCSYATDIFTVKAGYQLRFIERIGLTPQLGYAGQRVRGGTHGNGAMCHNLSIGARVLFNPHPSFGIFVNPSFAVPVKVNELYKEMAERSDIVKGGFMVTAGISFNFKI